MKSQNKPLMKDKAFIAIAACILLIVVILSVGLYDSIEQADQFENIDEEKEVIDAYEIMGYKKANHDISKLISEDSLMSEDDQERLLYELEIMYKHADSLALRTFKDQKIEVEMPKKP